MTPTRAIVIATLALIGLAGPVAASSPAASPDTVVASGSGGRARRVIPFPATPYDTTTGEEYHERHAFSLDHFFENWPAVLMERRGPIGGDADFSRYGIGKGRAALYLGYIPLNDPQDDRIPLALVPTSLFGSLTAGGGSGIFQFDRGNIEGAYRIAEPPTPVDKPVVAVELSRADRDLRQRRLGFSSTNGPIGIDFAYDELLNDGYQFDVRDSIEGPNYGKSRTRVQGGNVRGELPGGGDYAFSFRRFSSVFDGDLLDFASELRRDGHLAAIRTSLDGFGISVFERSHEASRWHNSIEPDSATSNHTAGAFVSVPVSSGDRMNLTLDAGYEDIHSRQAVEGSESRSRLQKGHAGVAGRFVLPGGFVAGIEANATHYFNMSTGWGAGVSVDKRLPGQNWLLLSLARRFRMPNLGELFQPAHASLMEPATVIAGNRYLSSESALEGSAGWFSRFGAFSNGLRATVMRVSDPIAYEATSSGAGDFLSPRNGPREELVVIEERAGLRFPLRGTLVELEGAAEYSPSGRTRFFSGVPEVRATARAAIGREFFKSTSALRLAAEFVHCGERTAGSIDALSAYDVVNVKIVVRLVDAHLYVQWLNLTDEQYQTVWPYLMTPRTFVYGVEWRIFD